MADRQALPAVVGSFSGQVFIDFLRRLRRDCGGRKVHLIVDGHPVHRAKLVSAWVGRHADRLPAVVITERDARRRPLGRRWLVT
jgi:hypothetical protein